MNIYFDLDHIEKGIKQLKELERQIVNDVIDEGLLEMADKISNHMSQESQRYKLNESNLEKTKYVDLDEDYIEIGYGADYANYVEYGTGIMGENDPHPEPTMWDEFEGYDLQNHGDNGWKYIGKDGRLHWTKGMPSRPIVYNTRKWANTQVTRVVRKHLRRVIE